MTPERSQKLLSVLQRRQFDLTVVLENVYDPHNISAVMRSCDAVGIQEIFVLNTRIARHAKWGARSSSSAAKWLTVHQYEDLGACMQHVRQQYGRIFTTHLATDAVELYAMDFTAPIALVFGNEHSGCSEDIIAQADGNFVIPQMGIIQSLNISVACAVSIYEAMRQKRLAGHYDRQSPLTGKQEAILAEWSIPKSERKE